MAEPQSDQYDSRVTLAFAQGTGYRRREPGGSPSFLDGRVALRPGTEFFPMGCVPAPPDHPNVALGEALLRLWPEVHSQFVALVDTVSLFLDPQVEDDCVIGSICGPGAEGFGSIAATVNHHVGFAEALVHELAHHKLRALGVGVETAERLVTNSSGQLHPSPIRYDCLRPMTAVVHAQYSYTYIAALDLKIVHAPATPPQRARRIAQGSLAVILPKLEFGSGVIAYHAAFDTPGVDFFDGFLRWNRRILEEGYTTLEALDVRPQPFHHRLVS
jgi:hypothetical protein